MKKITILLSLLLFGLGTSAAAETVHTSGADEYINALSLAQASIPMSAAEENDNDFDEDCILLMRFEGELDGRGAQYDICDEYDIHTLVYASPADAEAAYTYYIDNGYPVCRNMTLSTADAEPDQTYAPYLSWGVGYTGTNVFMAELKKQYSSLENMPNITVAVIDSGIDYTHPFFKDRVDISNGCDYFNKDSDPADDHYHGTHVAGIIADNTPDNVKIIPIKVTDNKGRTDSAILKLGIQKAIELDVDVINISITSDDAVSSTLKAAFIDLFSDVMSEIKRKNIALCVAAGNQSTNADYIFPAFLEPVITVANSTDSGGISPKSNYGSVVDLAAPGTDIYSTYPLSKGGYHTLSGTSMSAPFAAAAAALLKTEEPSYTFTEIETMLKDHTRPFSFADKKHYGTGILSMKALKGLPESVIDKFSVDTAGKRCTLHILNNDNILSHGATVIFTGVKNGIPALLKQQQVSSETVFSCYIGEHGDYDSFKVFVWNSLSDPTPLCRAYEHIE